MTMHKAFHQRDDVDRLQEERKEEDLIALKTAGTHLYKDSKTTWKSTEEDLFPSPETIVRTRGPVEQQ